MATASHSAGGLRGCSSGGPKADWTAFNCRVGAAGGASCGGAGCARTAEAAPVGLGPGGVVRAAGGGMASESGPSLDPPAGSATSGIPGAGSRRLVCPLPRFATCFPPDIPARPATGNYLTLRNGQTRAALVCEIPSNSAHTGKWGGSHMHVGTEILHIAYKTGIRLRTRYHAIRRFHLYA